MAVSPEIVQGIAQRYQHLKPHLNERQRRLWAGSEALSVGHGGLRAVSVATGMSVNTVKVGLKELTHPETALAAPADQHIRRPGGGRPPAEVKDPALLAALDALVEPVTRGDPESPLRWTAKSTQKLAAALAAQDHHVSAPKVARLLKAQNYSLQSNRKRFEGKRHPDRDGQFQHIHATVTAFLKKQQPVLSVDTKKKELIGNFRATGQEWQPSGQPVEVEAYDFPSLAVGKAVPYGIYDLLHDEGWVSVGISADTAEFAVETLRQWHRRMGATRFPEATEVLITADCGGSNSSRGRLWKWELQRFANETGLAVKVMHYPPGTSKWNKIEHRMWNHVTMNWRGRPLTSFQVVVDCIAETTTRTGLQLEAALDENPYEKGRKITDKQMAQIQISRDDFHGEWNYTIRPNDKSK